MKRRVRKYKILITLDLDSDYPKNIFSNRASYYHTLHRVMRQNGFAKKLGNKRIPHNTYCSIEKYFYDEIDIVDLINGIRDNLDIAHLRCMRILGCAFKISDSHGRNRNRNRPHGNSRSRRARRFV